MQMHYEVCCDVFHGFDWSNWIGTPQERLSILPGAQNHVLGLPDGKKRFSDAVASLSKASSGSMTISSPSMCFHLPGWTRSLGQGLTRKDAPILL
jgi:hypothetical protein